MKIGIDISQVVYGGGVSVYTKNLVEALLKVDKENQYTLFFSSLRNKIQNSKLKIFRIPPTVLEFLWNRLHVLPIEWLVGEVDVFHASDWTQPPAKRAKLVTTIHDLSFLRWPESVHPKVLAVQKRRLEWVKREVDHIIAVSRATKKEIVELLGIPEEKITVIYEGVPEDVRKLKIKNEKLKIIKKKFRIEKPYLFAYGSRAPRKNIRRLIKAFRLLGGQGGNKYQLVIVGDYLPEGKLPKGVVLTGFLPREEMLSLFSQSQAFVYPSLYEGFGLPVLEAFALGVPVVTSNISSMPEVAGEAAILVDPNSVDSIAEGIKKAAFDESVHRKLVRLGMRRLKSFSWEKAARKTLKVYQKVCQ
jgi:glycosyltransferase involved in cell wall biosynthesis